MRKRKQPPAKLPPRFKKRWVKALLEGKIGNRKINQTDGSLLKIPLGFWDKANLGKFKEIKEVGCCCLGVAGLLCNIPLPSLRSQGMPDNLTKKHNNKLPPALRAYLPDDLEPAEEELENSEVSRALAEMNDDNIPFEVIAGFIHENL